MDFTFHATLNELDVDISPDGHHTLRSVSHYVCLCYMYTSVLTNTALKDLYQLE